jgi:general secretion pathway protein N
MKLLLAVVALTLGGVLALQWRGWEPETALPETLAEPAATRPAGTDEPTESRVTDTASPGREEYTAVVERPLFLPTRRPPPEEEEPEPEPEPEQLTELDGVDLAAVIITPDQVTAWLRPPGAQKAEKLGIGEEFLGWKIKTIEPALVVLERQGDINEIPLRDFDNAPSPIPPTRLAPRRGASQDQPRGEQQRTAGQNPNRARNGDRNEADAPAGEGAEQRQRGAPPPDTAQRRQVTRPPARRIPPRPGAADPTSRQPPNRAPIRRPDAQSNP